MTPTGVQTACLVVASLALAQMAAARRLRGVARHIVGAASATPPSPLPITAEELPELVRMVDANLGSGVLEDTGSTFLTSHPRVYLPENLRCGAPPPQPGPPHCAMEAADRATSVGNR